MSSPHRIISWLALRFHGSSLNLFAENQSNAVRAMNFVLQNQSVWTIIGSSNFDRRSVLFNDEVDSVVLGRETGQQIEAMFEDDFKQATPIELATWEDRPLPLKIKEILYTTWQNQL